MNKYNKLLSLLLSISLSTTSCASSGVINMTKYQNSPIVGESISTNDIKMDYLTNEYYNYFDNLEFTYNYQEKYITRTEIESLIEENKKIEACTYVFDGDVTAIAELIKENSSNNDFFTQDNLQILTRLLKKIYLKSKSDKNEDFHKLSTIKIAYGHSKDHYVAYFDEDTNTLYLDKEYIEFIASEEVISPKYYLEYTLEHELDHVRQILCDCNKEVKNTNIGYGEYVSFILESSAESSLYNELDQNYKLDYTYSDERTKEGEILLLGLFNNESIDNYYQAIYDVNLEELYNYLDLSDEEVYDFYNILYSIDGSLCRNNLPYEIFSDVKDVTYGELKQEIGYSYKQNLFKMVIMRMLKYNSENNLSLEDNLAIYYLIKNILFYDCYYFEEDNDKIIKVYPEEIEEMIKMDEKYIEYLASKYHKSIEEVRDIESIDGYIASYSLVNYVETGEFPYDTYKKQVTQLIENFPTITYIINNYDEVYLSSYSSAVKKLSENN